MKEALRPTVGAVRIGDFLVLPMRIARGSIWLMAQRGT